MSKRNLARIISFLSAGILAVALFCTGAVVKAKEFERKTEAMYQKSLAQAGEYLADIDTVLLKGLYSKSAANQSSMCADLWRDAYEAKNAISSLPLSDIDMEQCYTYLSKVAEFARATEKQIASGQKPDAKTIDAFLNIRKRSATLANSFEKLENIYLSTSQKISGGIDFSFAAPHTISSSHATSEGLNALNKNLSNAPKLIYDGPFSDAVNEKQPQMLKNSAKIDLKKATVTAEQFLKSESGRLQYSGSKKGNIPSYCFKKGDSYVEISAYGGKVVSFNTAVNPKKTVFEVSECLSFAENYLKKLGYRFMRCNYYETANHTLIANFHYLDGEVNCYTDLVKIKIDCESGKPCGFDATSYLTNHEQRNFDFKLSAKQCQSALSPYLRVKSVKKALIPTADEKSALCYEYRAINEQGEEFLVFIGAADALEKDILILQIGEHSVLTK